MFASRLPGWLRRRVPSFAPTQPDVSVAGQVRCQRTKALIRQELDTTVAAHTTTAAPAVVVVPFRCHDTHVGSRYRARPGLSRATVPELMYRVDRTGLQCHVAGRATVRAPDLGRCGFLFSSLFPRTPYSIRNRCREVEMRPGAELRARLWVMTRVTLID